ncbi:MAG TPA: helix-turn-helix domain-containing protein [Acidimicrobiales bacterium]|nr:helix-turn-helix domain-containing protein [Acidimicrobiales bacterium]
MDATIPDAGDRQEALDGQHADDRQDAGDRRSRLPAEERRQHLLSVARRMVAESGIDAVTMESVATAAGVSKTLGYAYFPNRTELLLAVFQSEVSDLRARADAGYAAASDFEGKLRVGVGVWFDLVDRGGVAGLLLQTRQLRGRLGHMRQQYVRRLESEWGALAAAEFGLPPSRAENMAAALLAGLGGVLDRWVATGAPRQEVEEDFVAMVMAAVRGMASASADR